MLKDKHIAKLCAAAEDFVAETLCPMLEEMTGETCGDEFKKNLFATMMTVAMEISDGGLKIAKKGDKFVIVNRGAGEDDEDKEEETEEEGEEEEEAAPEAEKLNAMGEEMSALVAKVVRSAKKHAKNKDDYAKILAATAATIVEVGGKKAVQITKMHLNLNIEDIIKDILDL